MNSYGTVAIFVYILIAVSELRLRARLEREAPERLVVRMWAFPYLTYLAIAGMIGIVVAMALVEKVRSQLYLGLLSVGVVLLAYFIKQRVSSSPPGSGRFERSETDRATASVNKRRYWRIARFALVAAA